MHLASKHLRNLSLNVYGGNEPEFWSLSASEAGNFKFVLVGVYSTCNASTQHDPRILILLSWCTCAYHVRGTSRPQACVTTYWCTLPGILRKQKRGVRGERVT